MWLSLPVSIGQGCAYLSRNRLTYCRLASRLRCISRSHSSCRMAHRQTLDVCVCGVCSLCDLDLLVHVLLLLVESPHLLQVAALSAIELTGQPTQTHPEKQHNGEMRRSSRRLVFTRQLPRPSVQVTLRSACMDPTQLMSAAHPVVCLCAGGWVADLGWKVQPSNSCWARLHHDIHTRMPHV